MTCRPSARHSQTAIIIYTQRVDSLSAVEA
ncbi:hypothetical protein ABIB18_004531 [Pantoea sp. UYEF8]